MVKVKKTIIAGVAINQKTSNDFKSTTSLTKQNTNTNCFRTKQQIEESAKHSTTNNDVIKFGEVMFFKNGWQITYICEFCNKEMCNLNTFLKHTLTHMYDEDDETLQQLIDTLITEGITDLEYEQENMAQTNFKNGKEYINIEKIDEEIFVDFEEVDTYEDDTMQDKNTSEVCEVGDIEFLEENDDTATMLVESCTKEVLNTFTDEACTQLESDIESNTEMSYTQLESENETQLDVNKKKSSKNKLKRKIKDKFLCKHCDKYLSRGNLYNHMKLSKSMTCDMCNAVFNNAGNLRQHRNRHLGIKAHACSLCEKTFTTTTELKIHLRSHTGEKPYICTDCDACFTTSSRLIVHRRHHTNTRPYACTVCEKTFYSGNDLKKHQQSHSSERPYKCNECSSDFKTQHGLRQHKKIHLPEKQYKCQYCDKDFAQDAGLYGHIKNVHIIK